MTKSFDLSLSEDTNHNMIESRGAKYINGIITMLFNMKPNDDEYNPKKGLDIDRMRYTTGVNGSRNTQYEILIEEQFSKYTDIIASDVIAMYINNTLTISMRVSYIGDIYTTIIGYKDNDLNILINNN